MSRLFRTFFQRPSWCTGSTTHLGEEIFEEIQQILHGVEINEVDELGQAFHHRRKEGRRRRPTLKDAEIGQHHLDASEHRNRVCVRVNMPSPLLGVQQSNDCL